MTIVLLSDNALLLTSPKLTGNDETLPKLKGTQIMEKYCVSLDTCATDVRVELFADSNDGPFADFKFEKNEFERLKAKVIELRAAGHEVEIDQNCACGLGKVELAQIS
jgi:hypothetical protein